MLIYLLSRYFLLYSFFIKFDFLFYFFIEMANSANPVDDFMYRLSVDIFGEDIVDNTNTSQYYPQLQSDAPYYPRHANLPLHPQSNYIPHHSQYVSTSHEIIEESPLQVLTAPFSAAETPTSSVPPSSMEARPSEKKRKTTSPSYDAPWRRFYEQTKDVSGVILSGRCKVKNYNFFIDILR
jgi:hypothetical protein